MSYHLVGLAGKATLLARTERPFDRYVREEPIHLVPYNPTWPRQFEEERARLVRALSPWLAGPIEHIGSTAVPGLTAKPVIDIMAGVRDLPSSLHARAALAALDYVYFPYRPDVMHWFCKPSPARRTHHLHLVPVQSALWTERLVFRDYLRSSPAAAAEYAALKTSLAAQHRFDREAYTDAKGAFVQSMLDRARDRTESPIMRREDRYDVQSLATRVRDEGWAVTPPVVPPSALDELVHELTPLLAADAARGGLRHLLDLPLVQAVARSVPVRALAEAVLGRGCFAVRGILFDKTPDANWKVIWHQDLTIAVKERREVPGFGPWSEKDGVPHVQPPAALLERMVAVRVHLDDCGPENGPVRVIPRSHRSGRLSAKDVDSWKTSGEMIDCIVPRGGILAFHPLTLHASSPAKIPAHRRVVHLEFAADPLPGGLMWYHQV